MITWEWVALVLAVLVAIDRMVRTNNNLYYVFPFFALFLAYYFVRQRIPTIIGKMQFIHNLNMNQFENCLKTIYTNNNKKRAQIKRAPIDNRTSP